jgi:hypothetical protein
MFEWREDQFQGIRRFRSARVCQILTLPMEYIQLTESNFLPDIRHLAPFKAVIAIEDSVSRARQREISTWLVESGGKYVMVCGESCQDWEETIRQANLSQVSIEDMTAEEFVVITTHAREGLRNVFWHAKKHAHHTHVKMINIVAVHIGNQNRSVEYLSIFQKA